ncbi:MAG TPA: D-alanyl-D-alanine carboxypeptidase family protein [Bacillota bacterium]|jgi:D-alanyl-D-alanine carboxypeptidase (penicillin-binding protein 5/6)
MTAVTIAFLVLGPVGAFAAAPGTAAGSSAETGAQIKPPQVSSPSAVLIDWASGRVLFAKEARRLRPMASTTKIMTALLVLERGNLNDVVTVSRRAAATPGSSMHLRAGERLTLERVLYGILMRSGNDASVAAAEHIAGSEAAFVAMMNAKARALGAYDTQFQNPHGLTAPGHYSTAYDLALMARAALENPTFAEIVATREKLFVSEDEKRQATLYNTNRLLWSFEGADGVKTGTTSVAGKCLVASATRGDQRLIAVVLHSGDRWGDAARLLSYGFKNFTLIRLATPGQVLRTVGVVRGEAPRTVVTAAGDYSVALRSDEAALARVEWGFPDTLRAPVRRGDVVGEVRVYVGDELREAFPLVAQDDNRRRTPLRLFLRAFLPLLRLSARFGVE